MQSTMYGEMEAHWPDHPVMVDLETLGTRNTSVIVSIGAVKFDPVQQKIIDRFYVVLDRDEQKALGLTTDNSTLLWWEKQTVAGRAVLTAPCKPFVDGLKDFALFVGTDSEVWGNGADFDNAVLSHAYHKAGLIQPWKFWKSRCYRTAKSYLPQADFPRVGTHHNAVDDAESQTLHLMAMLQKLATLQQHSQ